MSFQVTWAGRSEITQSAFVIGWEHSWNTSMLEAKRLETTKPIPTYTIARKPVSKAWSMHSQTVGSYAPFILCLESLRVNKASIVGSKPILIKPLQWGRKLDGLCWAFRFSAANLLVWYVSKKTWVSTFNHIDKVVQIILGSFWQIILGSFWHWLNKQFYTQ